MALCSLSIHLRLCALFILWNFTVYLIYLGLLVSTVVILSYFLNSGIYCTELSLLGTSNFIQVRYLALYLIYLFRVTRVSFRAFHFEVDSIFTDNYGLLVFLKFPLLIFFGSQFLLICLIEALLFLSFTLCPVTCRQGASIHWVHQLFYLAPDSA